MADPTSPSDFREKLRSSVKIASPPSEPPASEALLDLGTSGAMGAFIPLETPEEPVATKSNFPDKLRQAVRIAPPAPPTPEGPGGSAAAQAFSLPPEPSQDLVGGSSYVPSETTPNASSITREEVRANARRLKYEAVRAKRFEKEARQRAEAQNPFTVTPEILRREDARKQEAFRRGLSRIKVDPNDPYRESVVAGIAARPAAIFGYQATIGGPRKLVRFISDSVQTTLRATFGDNYSKVLEQAGVTENDAVKHVYDWLGSNFGEEADKRDKQQYPFLASKMSLPEAVAEAAGDFVGNVLPKLTVGTRLLGGSSTAAFGADAAMTAFNRGASLSEGLTEGAKGALIGGILHTTNPLAVTPRALVQGGTMALDAALQGAPGEEILKAGTIGAGFGLVGGPKGVTTRRVVQDARDTLFGGPRREALKEYSKQKDRAYKEWYGTTAPDLPENLRIGDAERERVTKFYDALGSKRDSEGPPTPIIPPSPKNPEVRWSEEEQRWKQEAPAAPEAPQETVSPMEMWDRVEDAGVRDLVQRATTNEEISPELRQGRQQILESWEAKTPKTSGELIGDLAELGLDVNLDRFVRRAYGIPKAERSASPQVQPAAVASGPTGAESLPAVSPGQEVAGLVTRENVPNTDSISASLNKYEVLPGLREVPMDLFDQEKPTYYSQSEKTRTLRLAEEIKQNKELNPLIVVQDAEGFYILEGGHRFDALKELGVKSFPALVVKDLDSPILRAEAARTRPAPPGLPEDVVAARLSADEVRAAVESDDSNRLAAIASRTHVEDPVSEIGHAPLVTAPGYMASQVFPVKGAWALETQNVPPLGRAEGLELRPNMTDQRQQGTDPNARYIDPTELTNRRQIAQTIIDKFDILFLPGKIRAPGMRSAKSLLGWMDPVRWYARVRSMKDVGTIAHEAAHALDAILFATKAPELTYERSPTGHTTRRMIDPARWAAFAHELDPLASPSSIPTGITHEGFAEYISYYVLDRPLAVKKAPEFTKFFEAEMSKRAPEILGALRDAGEDFRTYWERMTPTERALVTIGLGGKKHAGTRGLLNGKRRTARSFINDVVTKMLNPYNPYRQVVIDTKGTEQRNAWGKRIPFSNIDVSENPEYLAQQLGGRTAGLVNAWLRGGKYGGRVNRWGEVAPGAESLGEILSVYDRRPLQLEKFEGYMIARRIVELYNDPKRQGIILPLDKESAEATVRHVEASDPLAADTFDKLRDYQQDLLNFLVDHQVITREAADKLFEANKDYVPMFAVLDNTFMPNDSGGPRASNSLGQLHNPIKGLRGGDIDRLAPLEGIIKNTIHFLSLGLRNELGLTLEKLSKAPNGGLHIRQVLKRNAPIKVQREELYRYLLTKLDPRTRAYQALENEYGQLDMLGMPTPEKKSALEDIIPDDALHIFRPTEFSKMDMVVPVFKKGKPVYLEVNRELYDAINGLPGLQTTTLIKFMGFWASTLRAGATGMNIEFGLKNLTRDQMFAYINSPYSKVPLTNFARGIYHLVKGGFGRDKLYTQALQAGIGNAAIVAMDRDSLRMAAEGVTGIARENLSVFNRARDRLSKNVSIPLPGGNKIPVGHVISHPIEAARSLSEYMEMISRMGSFSEAYAAERKRNPLLSEYELTLRAAQAARENTVDFSVIGSNPSYRTLAKVTAFLNARLQGARRAGRSMYEDPVGVTAKTMIGVVLPSLVAWAYTKDDGQVEDLAAWQRGMYYCIPTRHVPLTVWRKWSSERKAKWAETHPVLRIPRPEAFGSLGAFLEAYLTDIRRSKDGLGIVNRFSQQLGLAGAGVFETPTPTLLSIGTSLYSNRDALTQRPIIPKQIATLNIDPLEKRTVGTSPTAIDITRGLNSVLPEGWGLSPMQTQYMVRGLFGGLGTQALNVADYARERGFGKTELQESMGADPARTYADIWGIRPFIARYPTTSVEPIERFWELYDRLEKKDATPRYVERAEPERADQMYEANALDIDIYATLENTRKDLSDISAYIREINADKSLSAEKKRRKIDAAVFDMIDAAREAVAYAEHARRGQ